MLVNLHDNQRYAFILAECPGMLDLKGKAKWEAWNLKKGVTTSKFTSCSHIHRITNEER